MTLQPILSRSFLGGALLALPFAALAHPDHPHPVAHPEPAPAEAAPASEAPTATAGQGAFVFRYAGELSALPSESHANLPQAHGGFAVDPETGEVFFGLKGAGIIWMSNDLTEKRVLPVTEPSLIEGNFHNTTLLRRADGQRFLAFPDNEKGRVLLTTDEGRLVATLGAPREVNGYYAAGGGFNPTDTEYAGGRLYVADGYSAGNFISVADPWLARWTDFVFGGKTTGAREYGRFGTAHGITWNGDTRRLVIADRANSRIQDFDLEGTFLDNTKLPEGSLPCDVDFLRGYTLVGCLQGPAGERPAPFYILDQDGNIVSTVNPKRDFGLELFTHIHNATWKVARSADGKSEKIYVLATAWNPGGFAVFELVKP
ncbi:MAG: hypothetical protein H7A45_18345 [Verrucomicrobiales bacterium]|nr:hypothetical protein [Verrucomicrobiales bacterium]MCP5526629.1 hypothetical protein [Verrucomicrobiales bacterium]